MIWKKWLLLSTLVASFPATGIAQRLMLGIEGAVSQNTQLHTDPARPEDGRTQMAWLTAWHAGIQGTLQELPGRGLKGVSFKGRLLYARRGFVQQAQYAEPLSPMTPNGTYQVITPTHVDLVNTLDYLSFDLLTQLSLLRFGNGLRLYAEAGLGNNYLFRSHMEAGQRAPFNQSAPYNSYQDGALNRLNVSGILGAGLAVKDVCALFVQTNRGATPVFRDDRLRVTDWSWVFGVSVNLYGIR